MKLKSYDKNSSLRLGTSFSAGYDVASTEEITIYPNTRKLINTGLKLSYCPIHTYIRIAPRSGLSCNEKNLAFED
jgi:dUTPase